MNPPNGQAPIDYLNQIAPQAPKKPIFELNLRTIIIAAVFLVAIVVIISLVSSSIASSRKEPWERLSLRLASTAAVVDDASSKIKSSELRTLNSDLKLYLTNTSRDLGPHLTRLNVVPAKISKTVIASESSDELLATLEDGRLNAKYDTTYAREMGYQLSTLLALLQQLYGTSGATSRAFLETAYNNLTPIAEGVEGFSNSHE